jgi:nicotinamide-nucleotide amidase
MARGVRGVLLADVAIAITSAGGPSSQDGQEPGTVLFSAVDAEDSHRVECLQFSGDPAAVCASTTLAALDAHVDTLDLQ